jgi:2-oxoglutarate ferredoxin oxidoreductase subunit beta
MAEFHKTKNLTEKPFHYCPGCTHGIVHRLVAEAIEELGMSEKTIGVAPVGCAVFAYDYFNFDMAEAAHGRAPAMATGIKRVHPDKLVVWYQGDGDLASIGTAETVHSAARGENITVVFINNGIYGMTGGQMAPTTIMGQRSTTCQAGRTPANGFPVRMSEMLATLFGAYYVERVSAHNVKNVLNAKRAIKKALKNQIDGKGFSIVEVIANCPTNWGMKPADSMKYIEESILPVYPLGVFKDGDAEGGAKRA